MPPDEFVESGGFRIDPALALKKLQAYQSAQPCAFLIPMVRCAALGGATRFQVAGLWRGWGITQLTGYAISFDGEPLARSFTRDPLGCLLEESVDPRRREVLLARALVDVRKWKSDASFSLASDAARRETKIRIEWRRRWRLSASHDGEPADALLNGAHFPLFAITLERAPRSDQLGPGWYDRESQTWTARARGAWERFFEAGRVRGRIEIPRRVAPTTSHMSVCSCGIFAQEKWLALRATGQVDGSIDDLDLALTLSGTWAEQDPRRAELENVLSEQAEALLVANADEQSKRMPETATLLKEPALRELWRNELTGRPAPEGASPWELLASLIRREVAFDRRCAIGEDAIRTRWLRWCARSLSEPERDAGSPARKALWEAPLFLSTGGATLSLRGLLEAQRRIGRFCATSKTFGAPGGCSETLWIDSSRVTDQLPPALRAA